MDIEYEATFPDIDKDQVREKLRKAGAKLVKPEFLQKRSVFFLPKGHEVKGGWVRVRNEGDKITMSLKIVNGTRIEDQKEVYLIVSNFAAAEDFLINLGCVKKAYQENKREKWILNSVEITIDEWPFLNPFVEIEGKSETAVKTVAKKIGFDYSKALFAAAGSLISRQYDISEDDVNDRTPLIVFGDKNPYLIHKK